MSSPFRFINDYRAEKHFFEKLYNDYIRLMFATANRFSPHPDDAPDIVQEAFLNLLKHYEKLKTLDRDSLARYIYFTVKNAAIDAGRKNSTINLHETALSEVPEFSVQDYSDMLAILSQAELQNEITSVLNLLSENDSLLLTYKYFLDYSDEEIAERLGCKPGSVRMMLTRARRNALMLLKERGLLDHGKG